MAGCCVDPAGPDRRRRDRRGVGGLAGLAGRLQLALSRVGSRRSSDRLVERRGERYRRARRRDPGRQQDAADRTSGTTWSALTNVPVFGDDARAVRLVSTTLADLTGSGLAPLADSASDLESFLPRNGAVPLDALQRLQQPVAEANEAFSRADEDLSAEDPLNFVGPLRDRYRELAAQVSDGASALSTADTALQLLPTMLGSDGQRNYLLVFQNNAEVRATGGLPGAVTLLRVRDGELTLGRQAAGNSFGETDAAGSPAHRGRAADLRPAARHLLPGRELHS